MIDYKNLCNDLLDAAYNSELDCEIHELRETLFTAADAIEKLQADNGALFTRAVNAEREAARLAAENKSICKKYIQSEVDATNLTGECATLYAENERLKKQLNEAVNDIRFFANKYNMNPCVVCAYKDSVGDEIMESCESCSKYKDHFKWRGEEDETI